jgi:glycosyltransferase involved in cell wall biosynthesis
MTARAPLAASLVDPSLFTAPYDAALTEGLLAAGVQPLWATRPVRRGDRREIDAACADEFFYRRVDEAPGLPRPLRAVAKGFAHALGLVRLVGRTWRRKPAVVHFQWVVLPLLDVVAMWLISRRCPTILTVHDTVPFNGERLSLVQNLGFDLPIRLADRVIVHTQAGRKALLARGVAAAKVHVVPHGPLRLPTSPSPEALARGRDPRWTFVLFGEIKPYKGLDLLVEALGRLDAAQRSAMRLLVAGRARMDMAPILSRIAQLELESTIDMDIRRLDEREMADLFEAADSFVFPYRQIDASGVYFLVKSFGKWLVASRVGIFAEDMAAGTDGALVDAGDIDALARELAWAAAARPPARPLDRDESWQQIGLATRQIYEQAIAARQRPAVEVSTGGAEGTPQ